jgi:O-methyltransferase
MDNRLDLLNDLMRLTRLNLGLAKRWIKRGRGDVLERFQALRTIAALILPEYRFKWPQMAWWTNGVFSSYLSRFKELDGNNTDRRWALCQLLRLIASVEGDTAEVGVYRGASSWLICAANAESKKTRIHHMFDSFEGLSEPGSHDGDHWYKGALACPEDEVRRNLEEFLSTTRLYRGWVPERFQEVAERRFAFVHIDVDLYQPTWDSMEFFYARMNRGGVIVCDDYGFTSCPGATKACDEFLADKAEKMVSLPCGGGFMIAGTNTSKQFSLDGR